MQSSNALPDDSIDAGADSDSLFGSPPSSPAKGRSPTPPSLALPSGACFAQNVGTLALPGSHLVAELPVRPPASPLRSAREPPTSRTAPLPLSITRPSSSARSSTPGSSAVCAPVPRKRKTREKFASTSSLPTPGPPPIELPSPDEPLPPNFLRNQQALLGLAGLVGGVNPAQLPAFQRTRGSSAENPIVVEDRTISGTYAHPSSLAPGRRLQLAAVNPAQLPVPSSRDILATLVRQKNIFPVVESLLRLLVPGAAIPPGAPSPQPVRTGWERSSASQGPPLKRRKLSSVPAGAADWDVPYPFQAGQGPTQYRTTWEQERARRLLGDLLGLVQTAAKKASMQAYLQQQERKGRREWDLEQGPKVLGHYRPETLLYGLEFERAMSPSPSPSLPSQNSASGSGTSTPFADRHQSAELSQQLSDETLPVTDATSEPAIPFDELMASLFAVSNTSPPSAASGSPSPPSGFAVPPPPMSSENILPYFDNWLSLLSTCPPGDPDALPASASFAKSHLPNTFASSSTSTNAFTSNSAATSATIPRINSPAIPIPDFLIDPVLLGSATASSPTAQSSSNVPSTSTTDAYSRANPHISGWASADTASTPGLTASPFASTSSLPDPSTPDLAWTFTELDAGAAGAWQGEQVVREESAGGVLGSHDEAQACAAPRAQTSPNTVAPLVVGSATMPIDLTALSPQSPAAARNAGGDLPQNWSSSAVSPYPFQGQALPVASSSHSGPYAFGQPPPRQSTPFTPYASVFAAPAPGAPPANGQPAKEPTAKEARARLLARARMLRKTLVAAAERAKVELWETALEQGVLVGLAKEGK